MFSNIVISENQTTKHTPQLQREKKKPPLVGLCHIGELQKLLYSVFYRNSFLEVKELLHCPPPRAPHEFIHTPMFMPPPLARNTLTLIKKSFLLFCFSSGQAAGLRKPTVLAKWKFTGTQKTAMCWDLWHWTLIERGRLRDQERVRKLSPHHNCMGYDSP